MIKLSSWNVNSLNVRLEQVLAWLEESKTDILAIQETKTSDDKFPVSAFTDRGYEVVFSGQKTYNGVAIISKFPMTEVNTDLPTFVDPQRRILAVTVAGMRLYNLYVPNGSSLDSDKYQYKLAWIEKLLGLIAQELKPYPKMALVGDFNIAPEDRDVHAPEEWEGNVLVSPAERQAFADLLALGFHDSFRNVPQDDDLYSWWDYRAAAFRRNRGLRIDHIILSAELNALCHQSSIDINPRKAERPSDHAPVWAMLDL